MSTDKDGSQSCSCPAYKYRGHSCKHLSAAESVFGKGYNKKVPYQTPAQKAAEKRIAAKHGKAVPKIERPDNEAKIEADPGLKEFLDTVSK